jgi:23S rRNA-/tRNA-specific pseudouridylate synthase
METLSLNMKEVSDLLDIGAIYHLPHLKDDESITNKLGNLSTQQLEQEQQQPTHQTQALKSKPSAAAKLAKQPIPKRIMRDRYLSDQDYIRVHLKPRRYFNANKIDWAKRILYETSDYLVIDKPNGVPSHATMDNGKENVLECIRNVLRDRSTSLQEYSSSASALQQSVNLEDEQDDDSESEGQTSIPLFLPQRLDVETSGLMLIARNSMMIRMMNDWLKRDLIRKRYKALLTFNVDVKDDEEIAFIQDSIFTVQPLAPCLSSSSSASKFKLAGYFQEGDILTSYLKKSTVAPKFYYWSTPFTVEEVHCHPMLKQNIESPSEDMNSSLFSFQDCHSKVIKVSRPVIKSKQEWLRCVKSLENPGRGSESGKLSLSLYICYMRLIFILLFALSV